MPSERLADSAALEELRPLRLDEQCTGIVSLAGPRPSAKWCTYVASATSSPSRVSIRPLTVAFRPLIVSNFVRTTTNLSVSLAPTLLLYSPKDLPDQPCRVIGS